MISSKKPVLAIDFDGTIVDNKYPSIGKPKLFAFETLKKLQKRGFVLILWTYRDGEKLEEAVEFCKKNGIEFYAVNKSYPEEVYTEDISRKINADIFIDDRNVGGFLGWGQIYRELLGDDEELRQLKSKKKGFFESIFKKK
ncbi:BT0820 family HAD-type phosphatase [Psychroflexus montanilacus]|uniref:BT0820 family HAD-type phosphatase n=1 Tax=Psychroflexus montanilacus TaxID=2873598 RepID=UPI001CCEC5B8|nr:hydrolase [Psychroflexus montanilacus]MBZ9651297.1 hydrolase [Psychroflexus montanilacus]